MTAFPAWGDLQFRPRHVTRDDVPLGQGQCDIRLQVDDEVEVGLRGDLVMIRTISGREPRDDGSECNAPLPRGDLRGFRFEVKDSRNEIRLLSEPDRRNDFTAVVRIRDTDSGYGRYHFRLTWAMTGTGEFRRDDDRRRYDDNDRRGGSGFAWNNTIHFAGQGRGAAEYNHAEPRPLSDASVDIDRGGRIVVSFRAEHGRNLVFNGVVIGRDLGRLKTDVSSEDGRLRGPMYLATDGRGNVTSITLEATDGRDRLRLNWDRR
jgi:hypothetical protein